MDEMRTNDTDELAPPDPPIPPSDRRDAKEQTGGGRMNECCSYAFGVGNTSNQSVATTAIAARIAAAKGRRLYRLVTLGSVLAAVLYLVHLRILVKAKNYVRCDGGTGP